MPDISLDSALKQRLITAAIAIVVVLLALAILPSWLLIIVFGGLALFASWEWAQFSGFASDRDRTIFLASVGLGLLVAVGLRHHPLWLLIPAVAWWALCTGEMFAGTRAVSRPLGAAITGWVGIVGCFLGIVHLLSRGAVGREFLLALLVLVWVADSGAYFAGRKFGSRKLAPQISPNKTIEGVLGGLGAAFIVAIISGLIIWRAGDVPMFGWILLCLVTALVSVAGDLVQSREKRAANIKDSGSILPGHGGITDRIDSLLAAAAVFVCGLNLPIL